MTVVGVSTCVRSFVVGAVALLALTASACQPAERDEPRRPVETTTTPRPSPLPATPSEVTSRMLVTGNTFWGRYLEQWSHASGQGHRYPFSRLHELDRDRYDAWISGLECPTVAGLQISPAEQDRLLSFNCDPRFLTEAAKWFTAFSLANNHTDNQGRAGVDETRRRLRAAGIGYFGDPDPHRVGSVCSVIVVPARVTRSDGSTTTGHLPLGLCGFHGVFEVPPPAAVEVMRKLAEHVPVLALPHSGLEYLAREVGIKVDFYRGLVDNGADAVLGDHAHWVQNSEAWHGRPIVYSMGNFIFDQQDDAEVTRSAAIRVRLTVSDQPDLEEWLAVGERCASTVDCTAMVEASGLAELKVRFGFGVVGTSNAARVTHLASRAETAAILDRLDWEHTLAGLRPPYESW